MRRSGGGIKLSGQVEWHCFNLQLCFNSIIFLILLLLSDKERNTAILLSSAAVVPICWLQTAPEMSLRMKVGLIYQEGGGGWAGWSQRERREGDLCFGGGGRGRRGIVRRRRRGLEVKLLQSYRFQSSGGRWRGRRRRQREPSPHRHRRLPTTDPEQHSSRIKCLFILQLTFTSLPYLRRRRCCCCCLSEHCLAAWPSCWSRCCRW